MKLKDQINLFYKMAVIPGDQDIASTPSKAVNVGLKNLSSEEKSAFLSTVEAALGFVPVVGEGIGIYQGSKMLINAKSKWNYIGGALIIGLSLLGLKSMMPNKQQLIQMVNSAKAGNQQVMNQLLGLLNKIKLKNHTEEINKAITGKLDSRLLADKIDEADDFFAELPKYESEIEDTSTIDNLMDDLSEETEFTHSNWLNTKQFNVGGVLINFAGDAKLIEKYKSQIEMAYGLLNKNNLSDLWTGAIGVKPFLRGNSTGQHGLYNSVGEDILLSIQGLENAGSKYSNYPICKSLLHELGHRYWFKKLTPEQRAKWIENINVKNPSINRELPFTREQAATFFTKTDQILSKLNNISDGMFNKVKPNETIDPVKFSEYLNKVKKLINNDSLFKEVKAGNPTTYNEIMQSIDNNLRLANSPLSFNITLENIKDFENGINNELRRIASPIGKVPAVTNYGSTNEDEAFADSFAYFLMGERHNSDQLDLLKSVMNMYKVVFNHNKYEEIIKLSHNYFVKVNDYIM